MNKIEHTVYNLVKKTPWLKFLIRNIYQSFFDLLPRKDEFFAFHYDYKENSFFGFHDLDPFSYDFSKILSNKTSFDLRMPDKNDLLEVGYYEFINDKLGDFHSVGNSTTWNYHKGCRLQWISEDEVIYNTEIDNKLVSKIVNIENGNKKIIQYPVDTFCKHRNIASTFSYKRLEHCMPGYGYHYEDGSYLDEFYPEETGLFIIDIKDNKRKLLISLKELVNDLDDIPFKENYWHFVTHSEFSPNGKYLSFLHRWIGKDVKKRWTRLIVYNLDEDTWFSLPTTGWGVSHYVWNNNHQIIAYCSIDGIDSHVLFDIPNNSFTRVVPSTLNSDGHQSFINDTEFVTDTYPDKYRMAKLYTVDMTNNKVKLLASVHSPKKYQTKTYYKHIACDLHPRVSKNGKYLCFDSPRSGNRSIYVMKLNK